MGKTRQSPERDDALIAIVAAAATGLALSAAALALYGGRMATSVAVGAAIAVGNLFALRATVRSLVRAQDDLDVAEAKAAEAIGAPAPDGGATKEEPAGASDAEARRAGRTGGAAWGIFAVLKILILFGGIWVLLTRGWVDPIPLVVGYGAMPIGIALSTLYSSLRPRK